MANSSRFPRKIVDQSIYIKRSIPYLEVVANKALLKVADDKLLILTDEPATCNLQPIPCNM